MRVIRQENRGRSAARNACLRAATCDVVVFLDSDDRLEPECVELFATELERDADVCVAYGNAYFCDASGNRLGLYTELLPGPRPSGMVLRELTCRNFLMMASMVRRRCLEAISFDEEMECAEDYDFWRRVAVHCKFCYVDRPIVNYQLHDAGTVTTRLRETMAGEAEVQRRIMAMPEFNNLSRCEQARAFSIHGMKLAMLGEIADARKFFRRAIATSPTRVSSYTLLLLSLGGTRVMQSAILLRRRLVGNRLGTEVRPRATVAFARQHTDDDWAIWRSVASRRSIMKVLLCNSYYRQRGGEDRCFEDERDLLRANGHTVIEYVRHNDELVSTWPAKRFQQDTLESSSCGRTYRAGLAERPDVLHCTNTFPLISPAVCHAVHREGVAVVQALHNFRLLCAGAI